MTPFERTIGVTVAGLIFAAPAAEAECNALRQFRNDRCDVAPHIHRDAVTTTLGTSVYVVTSTGTSTA
jgi:hypothetical protein